MSSVEPPPAAPPAALDVDALLPIITRLVREAVEAAPSRAAPHATQRPGEITAVPSNVPGASADYTVKMDGDDPANPDLVYAQNLTGTKLSTGQRVMVNFQPPSGSFIAHAIGESLRTLQIVDEVIVPAANGPIVFPSLPGGYSFLTAIGQVRGAHAAKATDLRMIFNGIGGGAYSSETCYGATTDPATYTTAGAGAHALNSFPAGYIWLGRIAGNTADAGNYSPMRVDFPAYSLSQEHQGLSELAVQVTGSEVTICHTSWLFESAVPITQIEFRDSAGATFIAGSRVTLVGFPA